MITTSQAWKDYSALHNVYHIKAVLTATDGTVLNLTDEDFMMGSVKLSDACSSSNSFDIGAVITNTFECTFNNTEGKFNGFDFRLATIAVQFGVIFEDETEEWIDRGFFTLDNPSSLGYTIQVNAYDNMDKLNRAYIGKTYSGGSLVDITFPITSSALAEALCNYCGVTFGSWTLANNRSISKFEYNESTSCREVLSWVLQINCGFGRMNPQGELECKWYNPGTWIDGDSLDGGLFNPWAEVDSADGGTMQPWSVVADINGGIGVGYIFSQVAKSTVASENIRITGVRVYTPNTVNEFDFSTVGEDGYIIAITDNPLVKSSNKTAIAKAIYSVIGGLWVQPYDASIYGDPSYEAGDSIGIRDYLGHFYISYITNMSYSVGGIMDVSCGAETVSDRENEYVNPQTSTIQGAVTAAYDYILAKKISADAITAGTLGVNGTITATDLEITGGRVGGFTIQDGVITTSNTVDHTYTTSDITRITNILNGSISPTSDDYALYDIDGDRRITLQDQDTVQKVISNASGVLTATVKLNPQTVSKMVEVSTSFGTNSYIGAGGVLCNAISVNDEYMMDFPVDVTKYNSGGLNMKIHFYNSGIVVVHGSASMGSVAMTSAYGNGYYKSVNLYYTLNIFTSAPTSLVVTPQASGGLLGVSVTANAYDHFSAYIFNTRSETQSVTLHFVATGLWK